MSREEGSTADDRELAVERDAELEAARIRDLLGLDMSRVEPEVRVLARVLNRIDGDGDADADADAPDAGPAKPAPRARRDRARWLLAVAAVLVLGIAVTVSLLPSGSAIASPPSLHYTLEDPEHADRAPEAAGVLHELSTAAAASTPVGSGDVQYVESRGWNTPADLDDPHATIRPFEQQWWLSLTGAATLTQRQGTELRPDGTIDPAPVTTGIVDSTDETPPGTVPDTPAKLSRDPAVLVDQLLVGMPPTCEDSPAERAWCLLDQVNALTTTYLLPPDLMAAVWEMLAGEPGVRTLGSAVDRKGRAVETVTTPPHDSGYDTTVRILLVDPTSGQVVGSETVALETDLMEIDGPTVTGFVTITDARWVAEIGDTA